MTNNENSNSFPELELKTDPDYPVQIPEGFDVELFSDDLEMPTSIAFPPDESGRLFVNELNSGKIWLYINGEKLPEPFLDLAILFPDQFPIGGSRGLIGLEFDPDYETNRLVYISYASSIEGEETGFIARMKDIDNKAAEFSILLDDIPSYQGHQIQNITFGTDGMLYASIGDAYQPDLVQNSSTFNGKIIRMTKEGEIPPDNPYGAEKYVYAIGFRNAYDLIFDENDDLIVVDNGNENNDTFYRVSPGDNAGWPEVEGKRNHQEFIQPVHVWDETTVPVGMHYYRGSQFSTGFRDKLFLVLFGETTKGPDPFGKRIQIIDFDSEGQHEVAFHDFMIYEFEGLANPLDLAEGPDGSLYFSDIFQGMIFRIRYLGKGD